MAGKYTKAQLSEAVADSRSFAEVLRRVGKKWSGGQQQNLKRWIVRFGIDTSHFLGQRANCGDAHNGGCDKKRWQDVLIFDSKMDWRVRSVRLRRALIESGRPYCCECCGSDGTWRGAALRLQIDHKNNDWRDNRQSNLRFLCPNCHSQTQGWSGRI